MGVKTRNSLAINNNAGANVNVVATTYARYVTIQEDNAAPQGLAVTFPDGTVASFPANQPIELGNPGGALGNSGVLLGVPADYNGSGNAATVYCSIKSMTATATSVRVLEYN